MNDAAEELLSILLPRFNANEKLPDPALTLFYKNLKSRHLWLDTEVNWDNCEFLVQYIQYLNRDESDDMTPITIHVNSGGGLLTTMFTVYDNLKNSKIPIHTINEGMAGSAAFIIYLAGSKRTSLKDAIFVAHEGSGGAGGTYRETKAAMAQYDKDVARMAEIISEETNLTIEEINAKYEAESDWYIRGDDAIKYGIIKEEE